MREPVFRGACTALVTPFNDSGLDVEAFSKLIEAQIAGGIDALVICGTTGEASTLTDPEQIDTIKFAVDVVKKRVPVIAGVGSNDTPHGVGLTRGATEAGADALLHVTPYYNKASRRGLYEHFKAQAEATPLPILLYSVAGRTGMNIPPDEVEALAQIPNIVGLKEASGNISQVVEIARRAPAGFDLYSGNDDMIIPLMSVGGKGVISVLANVAPRDTHLMARRFLDGDTKGAAELQLRTKPLIDALFCEVNPIPVKAALHMMGKCRYEYRMPLCPMEEQNYLRLQREMEAYGLL